MSDRGIIRRLLREGFDEPLPNVTLFSLFGLSVVLRSAPVLADALRSHLYYSSEVSIPDWTVTALVRPASWAEWTRMYRGGRQVELDYGDSGRLLIDHAQRLVAYERIRTLIITDFAERQVVVLAEDLGGAFAASYKCIRHLITREVIASGAFFVHAAVVAVAGKGVAFLGRKGAGKSTALLSALAGQVAGTRYLSNDKVLARVQHGQVELGCWPTVASIGVGAIRAHPEAREVIRTRLHRDGGGISYLLPNLSYIDERIYLADSGYEEDKVRLTPSEVHAAFGVPPTPTAPLRLAVRVERLSGGGSSQVGAIAKAGSVRALLKDNVLPGLSNHPEWFSTDRSRFQKPALTTAALPVDQVTGYNLHLDKADREVVPALLASVDLPAQAQSSVSRHHFGVYSLCWCGRGVVVIRKSRGPYLGLLDLPGGHRRLSESMGEALEREISEELGTGMRLRGELKEFDLVSEYRDGGERKLFRHQGLMCESILMSEPSVRDGEGDVAHVEIYERQAIRERNDISPPLRLALSRFIDDPMNLR